MLRRSASPDEVLIIHLCLTGNESTIYSKHPFERGKHIEMNFATKLEPFSLLPCFCINSSFLSSSMPSCTLQRFCFLAPHILSLALSPALQFCPYSWHKVHFLCCLSSIFKLYSALQTSEAQLYSQGLVQQRMPAISWLCHMPNALSNLLANISPILQQEPHVNNELHQSPLCCGAKGPRASGMTVLSWLRKVVSCTF